jgi:7-cyano-7-deazaguanine synthase
MLSIVSFSGGMDSGTLLAEVAASGADVMAVSFRYGSKHNKYELSAAAAFSEAIGVKHRIIDLSGVFSNIESGLLIGGGSIPEGHYQSETMKQTVVPGRNTIFASILLGVADSIGADKVYMAVHSGDHAIYPDCRPGYFASLQSVFAESSCGRVSAVAPYLEMSKAPILRIGYSIGVDYSLTRTCYKDQLISCGRCGACQERLEAFSEIGKKDPLTYELHA